MKQHIVTGWIAMFDVQIGDVQRRQDCWQPDCGSFGAWRWIISWIYGNVEPLPWEPWAESDPPKPPDLLVGMVVD